jgi:hypothetical protein
MASLSDIFGDENSFDLSGIFNSGVDNFYRGLQSSGLAQAGSSVGDALSNGVLTGTNSTPSWWNTVLNGVSSPTGLSAVSGLSGLLTNYLGGSAAQGAAKSALSSLQQAYAKAGDASTSQFQTALELGRPYRELGAGLMPTYTMFSSGADPGRQTLQQLVDGGLYDWKKKQVMGQIDKAMAARGRWDSGAAVRAQTDAGEALAGAEATDRFNRQMSLENMDYGRLSDAMNLGAGFSNQGAGLAVNTGNTLANVYGTGGQATATQQNTIGNTSKSMYSGLNSAVQGGLNTYFNTGLLNSLGGF